MQWYLTFQYLLYKRNTPNYFLSDVTKITKEFYVNFRTLTFGNNELSYKIIINLRIMHRYKKTFKLPLRITDFLLPLPPAQKLFNMFTLFRHVVFFSKEALYIVFKTKNWTSADAPSSLITSLLERFSVVESFYQIDLCIQNCDSLFWGMRLRQLSCFPLYQK